jgi:6-phosphogluconolactonase (cycloisomerase 2 family)
MVIQKNSKKGNIIRYTRNNRNNRNITMFGGGPAPNQQLVLNRAEGIEINNTGYVFVADYNNHCIRIFSPNPDYTHIHTLGTPGIRNNTKDTFYNPKGLLIKNDILYVCDSFNHRIQVFRITINEANNTITSTHLPSLLGNPHSIGTGISGNTNYTFNTPYGLAIRNNILYVSDTYNNRIQVFRININDNNTITTIHLPIYLRSHHSIGTGILGNTNDTFNYPRVLAIENNILYVADLGNNRIQVFRITINDNNTITAIHLPRVIGSPHSIGTGVIGNTHDTFNLPSGIALRNNILYVADLGNHRIQVFRITINDNNTITTTHLPGANGGPHSIGTGQRGITNNTFYYPRGLAIHQVGDDNILYVLDSGNNRIQLFTGDITNPATLHYYDTIPPLPPRYTILTQNRVIPLDIRNTRCILCNFPLCSPITHNPNNNVNGYVVRLDTDPAQPSYFHYTCIYNYITNNSTVDISQFGISTLDTKRLINDNLDNNNLDGTNFFMPDFIILNRVTDVPVNSRDTPCRLCRFPLCSRVIDTNNNINGYVIHLHNLTNPNTYYYHYKCICRHFTQKSLSDNPYQSPHCATIMDRDDIDKLLNIDGKVDAVNGNGFY